MRSASEVAIIGAGPAGIAAAVYLKRIGVSPLLMERNEIGGLLRNANLVENYPGFPEGISGIELVSLLERQLRRWKIAVQKTGVTRITRDGESFVLHTPNGVLTSRFLIIATGTRPRDIELPGLDAMPANRVHYEVADIRGSVDGLKFLVVGGGDAAFDYALSLASKGSEADIIFKSDRPRCIPLLLARVKKTSSIRQFPRFTPESAKLIEGKVVLRCNGDRGISRFEGDSLLIACGREPELDLLPEPKKRRAKIRDDVTEDDGLFIVGDARRGLYRQVGIAVGDGIHAAMKIATKLKAD